MSLFSGPEEHAANPPETWEVVKVAEGRWTLRPAGADYYFETYPTRRAAVEDTQSGPYVRLYRQEADWYAGKPVAGWKPYRELVK